MDVTVDGRLAATLLPPVQPPGLNLVLPAGYVPLTETVPLAVSDTGPEWTDGRYFPVFPSTDRVYVFKMRTVLESRDLAWIEDFRINRFRETMMALTLVGMQGTINRSQPSVYLDWDDQETEGASRFWVPFIQEHAEVIELIWTV